MASAFVLALSKDLRHLVALLIWISYILPKVYPTTLPLPYYYLTTTNTRSTKGRVKEH
jgi:hypothetical protein